MMKIHSKIAIFTLITTLYTTAHAEVKIDQSVIEPGKVHEVCMTLTEGQNLKYSFKSEASMNFNIHYHEGEVVTFPVEDYLTDMADSLFSAPIEQGYCMMWTNPTEASVELNVEYEIQ